MSVAKKKAVFLNQDGRKNVDLVYSKEVVNELGQIVDLCPEIISANDLESKKNITSKAEYVFSTWGMLSLTKKQIAEYFPKLKKVFYAAGSVQYFARPFLESGIEVSSAWVANGVPVAEYTVAQIVLANKGFFGSINDVKKNHATSRRITDTFPCNYNVNVGLIGMGTIGSRVAKMLHSYKMNVYVYDIFMSDERAAEYGVTKADLPFIFKNCQTVSNHLANNEKTIGMLNYDLFSLMPDNATFINTGRGAQVVEKDLIRALREKPSRTALLDVTWPEPINDHNKELYELDNIFITPHIAGSLNNECFRMSEYMLGELKRAESGLPLEYGVTLEMLETMA